MKFYDKEIYELDREFKEIALVFIGLLIGFAIGIIAMIPDRQQLENELNQYRFNEYVITESQNDRGYRE